MKKILIFISTVLFSLSLVTTSFADSAPGDVILFLGEDLSPSQKEQLKLEMNIPNGSLEVYVSNSEEHNYLGNYISRATIGTKAISSGKITIGEPNTGISVISNNINWVSTEMYANALITAGVKDAKVYVTAPFTVSGTAALTGIIKAYEVSTGDIIPEEQKQVANEEMVETAKLADQIGTDEANTLITTIKEQIAIQKPQTEEEVKEIVQNVTEQHGINLTDAQLQSLVNLFNKIKDLNIDWNAVGDQLSIAKEKFTNFIESEQGKNLIEAVKEFFTTIMDIIKGWLN